MALPLSSAQLEAASVHCRHLPTAFGAFGADVDAALHHRVVAQRSAGRAADLAGFGAEAAGIAVQFRAAHHEIRAEAAHLGAIHQCADRPRFAVLAAALEAVLERFQTDIVAILAVVNAVVHVLGEVGMGAVSRGVDHVLNPLSSRDCYLDDQPISQDPQARACLESS